MTSSYDYSETFESRIQDVRLDGPTFYTSLLEMIDNSIGWGDSDTISISYDKSRMILKLSDNGPMGFKKQEALHRFFTLGLRNEYISSKTIGKFGRGGYKATMNISNYFSLSSFIGDKEYTLSTDFIDMIENNTQQPTGKFEIKDNTEEKIGSHFELNIRPGYHNTFDTNIFKKQFVRAFHLFPQVKGIIDGEGYIPSKESICGDFITKTEYILYWNSDTNTFDNEKYSEDIVSDSESETSENINNLRIGCISVYILKNVVSKNDYLGEHPGIDFYRNNRLCNTHNPLRNIGSIGENLKAGQLRGGRCHLTFEYVNIQLSDNLDVDECIGLTTNKEIPEDTSKFNVSLLKILEEKARECSKRYEIEWKSRKDKLSGAINEDYIKLCELENHEDEQLYRDTLDIIGIHGKYKNFKEFKHWKINEENLTYYYYPSKKEIKEAKDNNEDIVQQRANWPTFNTVDHIIKKSDNLIKNKHKYSKYLERINKKKESHDIEFKIAKTIIDLEEGILMKKSEVPSWIDKPELCSQDYDNTINIYKDIIKIINKSDVETYFKDLNKYTEIISHYEKIREVKILEEERVKEEEDERIKAEEEERIKAEEEEERIKEAEEERIKAEEEERIKEEEEERIKGAEQISDNYKIFYLTMDQMLNKDVDAFRKALNEFV